MIGKKILNIFLPIVVGLSIIGTGFASWYFSNDEGIDSIKASVYVASSVTRGNIEIINQPSRIIFSEGEGNILDLKDGIDFYSLNKEDNTYLRNDKLIIKYVLTDENDLIENNNFKFYITLNGFEGIFNNTSSRFIEVSKEYESSLDTSIGYDFKNEIEDKRSDTSEDNIYGYYLYTLSLNDCFEYTSSEFKPVSEDNYKAIHSSLINSSINIKFVIG